MPFPEIQLNTAWSAKYATAGQIPDEDHACHWAPGVGNAFVDERLQERPFVVPLWEDITKDLWYLAHPCRHAAKDIAQCYPSQYPEVSNQRSSDIYAAELMARGVMVFAPVSYTVPLWLLLKNGTASDPPKGDPGTEWWFQLDLTIAKECVGLLLCPGWETSLGCLREVGWFEAWHRPIATVRFVHPGDALNTKET